MAEPLLTAVEITAALDALPGCKTSDGARAIEKTFVFAGFVEAFAFMADVAQAANDMDHHPDWSNAWRTVRVSLSTHDAGGITARDIKLAQAMEKAAARH